jgi:uncharacterized protein DUF3429
MARRARLTDTPAPISPRSAQLLGYGGLVPFAGTGVLAWISWPTEMAHTALQAQLVYAAIVLSFIGGIRWGIAMTKRGHFKRRAPEGLGTEFALAAMPAIIGWLVLFAPAEVALVVFALFFAAQALSDRRAVQAEDAPDWYGPMRLQLTIFVELAFAASLARLLISV